MSKVLKGAIIGCGWFAENHLEAWRRIPEVEIVAAADLCLERARKFAVKAYASAEELLDHELVDFVDIATPAPSHLPMVRLAAQRKLPIICQKPIAPEWAEAVELVRAAEEAGVRLMIHENWRWQPWYRQAQKMIARGDIGIPIGYGFQFRRRDGLGDEPYLEQVYFRKERRLIMQQALVHLMDTARFLFGDIASVYAQTSRRNPRIVAEDQAIIVLSHANWVHGWVDGHRFLNPIPPGPAMGDAQLEGEDGVISILATGDILLNNARVWSSDVAPTVYGGDCVRATQLHFISCLNDGSPFESGGRSYLHTFAAVEAAYRSSSEQRCIPLAEIFDAA